MAPPDQRLLEAVGRFRSWASRRGRGPFNLAWECDYEDWAELHEAVLAFVQAAEPGDWCAQTTDALLYAIARDNELEFLADQLKAYPQHLKAAATAAIHSAEPDAKWQLACALAKVDANAALPVLEALVLDAEEYVSRRALLTLGELRSLTTEAHAKRAWETGHEYQRIAALEALHDIDSPELPRFLALAEQDGRQYLCLNAQRIRAGRAATGS